MKRLSPPMVLLKPTKKDDDSPQVILRKKDLDGIFEGFNQTLTPLIEDCDYTESNKFYNRVKNYSFVRQL
jgi:hypothetical protein